MNQKLKIVWIGGNHLRHLYFLSQIQKNYSISAAIIQQREEMIPTPPIYIDEHDKENFIRHFEVRDKTEKKYFGIQTIDCQKLYIAKDELNSQKTIDFINLIKPDIVLLFGCDLIKDPLYSRLPRNTINLHGGLSPRYKGTATMFWPFYFMEPNHVGSTFHHIVSEPDAGEIVHQTVPKLERSDGIHDVACKTIVESAKEMTRLLEIYEHKRNWQVYKQKGSGRNFRQSDFRAEHLRIIYDLFNDDMVKFFLDGRIKPMKPNLVKQF